jgi:hypothetical protein
MDTSPYAIERMANGSFVVMKVVDRSPTALAGRDAKFNAFRGAFATREEAEREVARLVTTRRIARAQQVV